MPSVPGSSSRVPTAHRIEQETVGQVSLDGVPILQILDAMLRPMRSGETAIAYRVCDYRTAWTRRQALTVLYALMQDLMGQGDMPASVDEAAATAAAYVLRMIEHDEVPF